MKKILNLFACIFFFASISFSQSFILHIKNNAHIDLMYGFDVLHGASGMLPGQIKADQSLDLNFSPNPFTGVEGYLHIFPVNQPEDKTGIYYVNPFIGTATYSIWSTSLLTGKPLKWEIINSGTDAELSVEIFYPNSSYGKPVEVAVNSKATIKGSIFWNLNDIQSPEINPYGNAFTFKVLAPKQFIESNGPFTFEKTGTYSGKKGYFEGNKEVGNVTYETVSSFNPNYVEIKYTITGVSSNVPLELDVTADYSKSKWIAGQQKTKPGDDYVFIVGTFPSVLKGNIIIDNNLSQISGVDFNCDGDWLKLDVNGKITGGGNMVNKIASRKTNSVLPGGGMIVTAKTSVQSNQMMQAAGLQNKTQQVEVQKVRTAGAVKIRQ